MRIPRPIFIIAMALALPAPVASQASTKVPSVERFDVSGLPKVANTEREKEILLLVQYHKRGDLRDATRIHMMLAQYYRAQGDKARAAKCTDQATEAWEAAEEGLPVTAGAAGTPPFGLTGVFRQSYTNTDDLGLVHRWDFFDDGSFAHTVADPKVTNAAPPREVGWYTVADGQLRLWQKDPATDRTLPFQRLGKEGREGAVLDGVKLVPVR